MIHIKPYQTNLNRIHNPEVAGSIPALATSIQQKPGKCRAFVFINTLEIQSN